MTSAKRREFRSIPRLFAETEVYLMELHIMKFRRLTLADGWELRQKENHNKQPQS